MQLSDALSAEDGWVLGAVEVFNSLVVDCAQVSLYFFTWVHIFLLEAFVKVYWGEERVLSNDFVKNVKVERELVNSINSFQHFSADWALNLVISEEVRQTRSAEGVAAAHNDSGNSCTNIVL